MSSQPWTKQYQCSGPGAVMDVLGVVEEEDWGDTGGRVSATTTRCMWRDCDTLLRQIGKQGIMLTRFGPCFSFLPAFFKARLDGEGGGHCWVSGHWEDKPKCPKNRGGRVGELGDEGQDRGQKCDKVCDSVLETVWVRFVKAPQRGKERRVVGKGPLEDGE
jgi:hypothetical protein